MPDEVDVRNSNRQNTTLESVGTARQPPVARGSSAETAPQSTNSSSTKSRVLRWLEVGGAVAELMLLFVGLGALWVYRGQLEVMKGQLAEMKGSGRQTDQLLSLYQQQLKELTDQAHNTAKLAESASSQARASKTIAGVAETQAAAMKAMAQNSATELETMDRAWLNVDVTSGAVRGNPVEFIDGSLQIYLRGRVTNVGRAAANDVSFASQFFIPSAGTVFNVGDGHGKEVSFAVLNLQKTCRQAESSSVHLPVTMTFSLFPNVSHELLINKYFAEREMESKQQTDLSGKHIVWVYLCTCVDYTYGTSNRHHQTGAIYEVWDANGPIEVGKDVPADKLNVVRWPFGGEFAR